MSEAYASSQGAVDLTRPPAIRVRHLWQRFTGRDVLRDVTFDVPRGSIFGFIGPNGAGKTTTIRVMATLLEPTAGRVEVDGLDVTMAPEDVRRVIGYMPDHAGVYDRITVVEYLEFFADAFRVTSLRVVDAVLELTDIGHLRDQLVATLSKGQKQRLQLARILLHDPEVLILDEPASDLDPRARIEIRDLLCDLQKLGKTIILSSHILSELSEICTSIGIIEHGRMVVAGPIGEISARLAQRDLATAQQVTGESAPLPWQVGLGAPPSLEGVSPMARLPYVPAPTRRVVKVRTLGDPSQVAWMLQHTSGVMDVTVVGRAAQVGFVGDDQKIAEIVGVLVQRGASVVAVEHEKNELERIFLEATAHHEAARHGAGGGVTGGQVTGGRVTGGQGQGGAP